MPRAPRQKEGTSASKGDWQEVSALRAAPAAKYVGRLSTTGSFSYREIAEGLPAGIVGPLAKEGLTRADIHMVVPERTLARRLSKGEALTIDEADALARLRRVVGMARRVFGDPTLADEWLRSPNPALEGEVPIRMARTDVGGREVEAVLGRIEHGIFG